MIYNIYMAGVGGQGVIKASQVLGKACLKKGVNVVMSEIHGMSQRGGSVPVEVRIGDAYGPIIPEGETNLLIAFEPSEGIRAYKKLSKDSIAVVNTNPIVPFTVSLGISKYEEVEKYVEEFKNNLMAIFTVDALSLSREAGSEISTNMVMLGAGAAVEGFPIEKEFLEGAIKESFSQKFVEANIKAFELGYESIKRG